MASYRDKTAGVWGSKMTGQFPLASYGLIFFLF